VQADRTLDSYSKVSIRADMSRRYEKRVRRWIAKRRVLEVERLGGKIFRPAKSARALEAVCAVRARARVSMRERGGERETKWQQVEA